MRVRARGRRGGLAAAMVAAVAGLASCEPGPDGGGDPEAGDPGPAALAFRTPEWSGTWYKGNTHTHTTESDGDSSPEYVARWYRDHGYSWLVLSDHNVFTDPTTLAHLVDETFLLIPGEEVTSSFEEASVHVNGLNLPGLVEARRIRLRIAQDRDFRYSTAFVGSGGRILHTTPDNPAVFDLATHGAGVVADTGVPYVRAEVRNSRGDVAWIQPVFVTDPR